MASVISFLFCAFLALQLAHRFCAKDPQDNRKCSAQTTTLYDTYLKGYNIATLFVDEIVNCFMECMSPKYSNCMSFTFQFDPYPNGLYRCELKNASKSTVKDSDMVARPGIDYVDVSSFSAKRVCTR